ncbi:MAG: hypothetical protein V7603_48 [Micromonosporaceae bacterium]
MRIDEESAGTVLSRLDEDPVVPSTVDIVRAVTDGRRRRRNRRLAGYAAVAGGTAVMLVGASAVAGTLRGPAASAPGSAGSATASVEVAPPGPTSCAIKQLPLPDGRKMALVTGGDPVGRFLLGRTYPDHSSGGSMGLHVVIWDRLRPTVVAVPGDDQSLQDVNSHGVAVGSGWGQSGTVAYYYRDGKVAKLPGGDGADAKAINDAGSVVGERGQKPVVWRSVDQAPVDLALPSGAASGAAVDIDEDGTVIGAVGADLTNQRPYVWSRDGSGHYLVIPSGVPPVPAKSGATKAGAVNTSVPSANVRNIRNGWVTGRVNATPVRWNLRTGDIRQFPEFGGFADGINRYGWQIGLDTQSRARLVADAAPVVLPELAKHRAGSLSNIPTTISDDGKLIGGQSDDGNDVIHAVMWTCS